LHQEKSRKRSSFQWLKLFQVRYDNIWLSVVELSKVESEILYKVGYGLHLWACLLHFMEGYGG